MPLPSLAAIAVREGTFQLGGGGKHPPPAMLHQKKPGRIRVKGELIRNVIGHSLEILMAFSLKIFHRYVKRM